MLLLSSLHANITSHSVGAVVFHVFTWRYSHVRS